MNTAEILRAAAERVRKGWCQMLIRNNSNVCALGAIGTAGSGDMYSFAGSQDVFTRWPGAVLQLQRALALPNEDNRDSHWARHTCAIGTWNDAPEQTAENVAAGLEYAALLWEQEQAQSDPARLTPLEQGEVIGSA